MQRHTLVRNHIAAAMIGLFASTLAVLPTPSVAQSSTATIRGKVTAAQGQMPSQVIATNTASGFIYNTKVNADGSYTLVGIPSGSYNIETMGGSGKASRKIIVQVGQSLTLNLDASKPAAAPEAPNAANAANLEAVNVTASTLVETRTSEVATNISQKQIQDLPQNERNFIDFAKLVPGVTVSRNPDAKTFSANGQSAQNVNVFIDGASLKNDVLKGGLVGQDSTRGNPFSQEAVKEFRVLTNNYKAEYEQAGSAIITAVTKSGTNQFHGSLYDYYQNQSMIAQNSFDKKNHVKKPDYKRQQRGVTLGGPILKDTLTFFINYEERNDTANKSVSFSDPGFTQYNGTFAAPFKEKTFFGKLSWQVNPNNNVDLSLTTRRDNEVLGFGGTTAYSARTDRENDVNDLLLKWQNRGENYTNDFLLDASHAIWRPGAAEPDLVQQNYEGIGVIGGASNLQNKGQNQTTIRDDFTWFGFDGHTIKGGIKYASYGIILEQFNNAVPQYVYSDQQPGGFITPYKAIYTPFAANANLNTDQIGLYIQDDWDVSDRLQLNLGVRWDYETNANNKHYVTPVEQIPTLDYLGLQDYISTGNNRKPFKGAIQPRLGFSLDVSPDKDQSTTLFGGAGRYYDRTPFDWIGQEAIYSAVPNYTFLFSPDGSVPGTIAWDPKYMTAAGLDALLAAGNPGFSTEIDVVNNHTRPPHTDQFSLGVRQTWGDWNGSLTLVRVLGYDQFTWIWNREPVPGFSTDTPPGSPYGNVLHNAYKKTQSSSVLISLQKPYTDASGWGMGLAYTYLDARQQGNDNYSLDYVDPSGYPADNVGEKHHLVLNGIVRGPWDTRLSGIFTYGSGLPYDYFNNLPGCDYNCVLYKNGKYGQTYVNLDLSLAKTFTWGKTQALELRVDVLNVFNRDVENGYVNNLYDYGSGAPNPDFGKATGADPEQTRRYQVGVRYSF